MQRVAIIGPGGAGKSTLAGRLGKASGLPVIHLDREHWKPGWVETPPAEWEEQVRELSAAERWVIDGNYGGTLGLRLDRADTVVFLDFGRWRCLRGVIARRLRYHNRSRPDMAEGCTERLDTAFLKWIWTYRKRHRPGVLRLLGEAVAQEKQVVVLRNDGQVARFLAQGLAPGKHPEPGTRMLVVGAPGSGKTTFARGAGDALRLSPIELDAHLWSAERWEQEVDARRRRAAELTRGAAWVLDGEYRPALQTILENATVVVQFVPRPWTALARRLRRGDSLPDSVASRSVLARVRLWAWILTYPVFQGPAVSRELARVAGSTCVIRITSGREGREFVAGLVLGAPRGEPGAGGQRVAGTPAESDNLAAIRDR